RRFSRRAVWHACRIVALLMNAISTTQSRNEAVSYHGAVSDFKRRLIETTLHQALGNRTHAARTLGLHRTYLLRLIRELQVAAPPDGARGGPAPTSGARCGAGRTSRRRHGGVARADAGGPGQPNVRTRHRAGVLSARPASGPGARAPLATSLIDLARLTFGAP